jgi:hypothetical protein
MIVRTPANQILRTILAAGAAASVLSMLAACGTSTVARGQTGDEAQIGGEPVANANGSSTQANAATPTTSAQRMGLAPWAGEEPSPMGPEGIAQVSFAQEGADFDPFVTRDGKKIVFASTQHRTTSDIYIKTVEGKTVTQLTTDTADDVMPAVSPDGQRIAFSSNRSGSWQIFTMPITGGKAMQITTAGGDNLHASWSPDGSKVVYCRLGEVSGRWELWVGEVQRPGVAQFIGYGMLPEWCPVGGTGDSHSDKILFQLGRERGQRTFGIWTLDYQDGQASNATELATSNTSALINPAWSPDGQRVVFAEVPNPPSETRPGVGDAKPVQSRLCMVNIDGTGRVSLTNGRAVSLMPAWGNGTRLFFVSNQGGTDNIWSMDMGNAILASGTPIAGTAPVHASTNEETQAPTASAEPASEATGQEH